MNWLERYVEGVKRYLPGKTREDIGEEIMSVLADTREAKEETLGREMNEKELKEWIGGQKHPLVLASGYQERRELVTAELFPLYVFALKIAILIIFGLQVVGAALQILTNDNFEIFRTIFRIFPGLIEGSIYAFTSITLVFHFLGKHFSTRKFFYKWQVNDLPKSGAGWLKVPVGEMIFEIVAYIFALGILNSGFIDKWDIWWTQQITLNPAIFDLVSWINMVIVLSLIHRIWLVVKPFWTLPKLGTNIGLSVLAIGVLSMFFGLSPFVEFNPEFITDDFDIDRNYWVNKSITFTLYFVGAVYLYEIGRDLYRVYRLRS